MRDGLPFLILRTGFHTKATADPTEPTAFKPGEKGRDQFLVTQFWFTIDGLEPKHIVLPKPEWKPMEEGAEVIRFRATGSLPTVVKFDVRIEATRTVQLLNTGPACDGLPVGGVLSQLMEIVKATIGDFGRKFFGERLPSAFPANLDTPRLSGRFCVRQGDKFQVFSLSCDYETLLPD